MTAILAVVLAAAAADAQPATPERVRRAVRALGGDGYESSRRWAADWLTRHAGDPLVAASLDALLTAIRADPVPAVRAAAVGAAGAICRATKRPTPDAVRVALTDGQVAVFAAARQAVLADKPLSPASVAALVAAAPGNDPDRRWALLLDLCWHGRHDPAAVAALRRATADPCPKVVRAARLGVTSVTGELSETVPFIFRYHATRRGIDQLPDDATDADKAAATFAEVSAMGDLTVLGGIMRERAGETSAILIAMLDRADDRVTRAAAVWFLVSDVGANRPLFTPAVRDRLAKLAAADPDPAVKGWSAHLLTELAKPAR